VALLILKLDSFWLYSGGEAVMDHDVRVAGGTADIETGQLLVI